MTLGACLSELQLGSTVIGVRSKEGVVLAVEKRITSPLLVRLCRPVRRCFFAHVIDCRESMA